MNEQRDFETRLAEGLRVYVAVVDGQFDAAAIAASAVRATPAGGWIARLAAPLVPGRHARLALIVLLLITLLVGGAVVGARLLDQAPTPDRALVHPAEIDPCALLSDAVVRAGVTAAGDELYTRAGHDEPSWDIRGCVFGWDDSYSKPHLLWRAEPTSLAEVEARAIGLVAIGPDLLFPPDEASRASWKEVRAGEWVTTSVDHEPWSAVALSREPYFFVVTARDLPTAYRLARAIAAELGFDASLEGG